MARTLPFQGGKDGSKPFRGTILKHIVGAIGSAPKALKVCGSVFQYGITVGWMSGLNRHPAKVLLGEIRAVGSNPTPTTKRKR